MFILALFPPLLPGQALGRATTYDLNPDVTAITWTTALPGGFGDLQVGMRRFMRTDGQEYGRLEAAIDVQPFGHVQVWSGSFLCFEGRVMRRELTGGEVRGFGAVGYGLSALTDDVITSLDTMPRTSGVLLRQALAQRAPLLGLGGAFADPGVLHAMSDYNGQAPSSLVNTFLQEGGANGVPWDYWAYENRQVNFVPRLPPSVPDYLVPFDDRVTWQEDYTPLIGAVLVAYSDLESGANVQTGRIADPTFAGRYGFSRAAPVSGGTLRAESAITFGRTYLAVNNVPQYAVQVSRERLRGLERPGAVDAPPWTVRSGEWLGMGDRSLVPIMRTQFDGIAGTLQVDAGQPLPDGANLVRDLSRVAAHVVAGTNPVTGARA